MIRSILFAAIFIAMSNMALAQSKYSTKTGTISFFSNTGMEDIAATNKKAVCVLNAETGQMEFAVLMNGFEFKKALMQEHFRENYVESVKYPKSTFKGKVENMSAINLKKDGVYNATIVGDLTLHGVTKQVKTTGTFTVKNGKVSANSVFTILLADYKIEIPAAVKDKISPEMKITVDVQLEPLQAK